MSLSRKEIQDLKANAENGVAVSARTAVQLCEYLLELAPKEKPAAKKKVVEGKPLE